MDVIQEKEKFIIEEINKTGKYIFECDNKEQLFYKLYYLSSLFFMYDYACGKKLYFSKAVLENKTYDKILDELCNLPDINFCESFLLNKNFHSEYLKSIFEVISNKIPVLEDYILNTNILKTDFECILHDFLKSINQEKLFDKLSKEDTLKVLTFKELGVEGITVCDLVDRKFLVGISDFNYTLYNLLVLVHEYGHVSDLVNAENTMNSKKLQNYLNMSPYKEVSSTLYEKMFYKYLIDNNIFNKEVANIYYFDQVKLRKSLLGIQLYGNLESKYLKKNKYKEFSDQKLCNVVSKNTMIDDYYKRFLLSYDFDLFDDCSIAYGNIISSFLHDSILEEKRMDSSLVRKFMDIRSGDFDRRFIEDNDLSSTNYEKIYTKEFKRIINSNLE